MIFALFAKFLVSIAALYWAFSKIDWQLVNLSLSNMSVVGFFSSVLILCLMVSVSACRQRLVFKSMRISIPSVVNFIMVFRGAFLNQILPGGIGGDGYRILKLTKNKLGKIRIASAIFWDRVLGFFFIVLLTSISFIFQDIPISLKQNIVLLLFFVWSAILAAILAAFLPKLALFKSLKLKYLLGFIRFGRCILNRNLLKTFFVGLLCSILICSAFYILTNSLNLNFSFLHSIIWCGLCVLVTIVPISLSGWGVREGVLVIVFQNIGIAPEKATLLGVSFGLSQFIVGLLCGAFFFYKPKLQK